MCYMPDIILLIIRFFFFFYMKMASLVRDRQCAYISQLVLKRRICTHALRNIEFFHRAAVVVVCLFYFSSLRQLLSTFLRHFKYFHPLGHHFFLLLIPFCADWSWPWDSKFWTTIYAFKPALYYNFFFFDVLYRKNITMIIICIHGARYTYA